MSELCIDASVAVKLVLKGEPFRNKARQLLKDCLVKNITLIAPPFFESETDTVICKRVYDIVKVQLAFVKYLPDYP